jgi:hypothetical protein
VVSHSLNSACLDGGSRIVWEDGERAFCRSWQLDDEGKRRTVLLVALAADQPSRSSLDRLTDEYELKDELEATWAVRPLELVRDAGRTILVLEVAGGEPGAVLKKQRERIFRTPTTATLGGARTERRGSFSGCVRALGRRSVRPL